jgi:hypothetical protein
LPLNDLPDENSGTAGRIGEVGLETQDIIAWIDAIIEKVRRGKQALESIR